MSLRNNRATKLNRYMMFGMFFLGLIVLGCVFGFLYLSYNKTDNPFVQQPQEEGMADSIILLVNDSTLVEDNTLVEGSTLVEDNTLEEGNTLMEE